MPGRRSSVVVAKEAMKNVNTEAAVDFGVGKDEKPTTLGEFVADFKTPEEKVFLNSVLEILINGSSSAVDLFEKLETLDSEIETAADEAKKAKKEGEKEALITKAMNDFVTDNKNTSIDILYDNARLAQKGHNQSMSSEKAGSSGFLTQFVKAAKKLGVGRHVVAGAKIEIKKPKA